MHTEKNILPISEICEKRKINLPELPGVYAFWWLSNKAELMSGTKTIVLKGPNGQPAKVEYDDWWPPELEYPCLYVGKTTNIKKRFLMHIKRGTPGRLHAPLPKAVKAKPHTTSCQLRFGIEHIFPDEEKPLEIIYNSVGFSFNTDFEDNPVAERFYEELRLIGLWRPWFNIDSER